MKTIGRWVVAFLAVIAAVAIPIWLCGEFFLRDVLKDPGVRWGVAAAPGLAVAAFVALWADRFVKGNGEDESPGNVRNIIKARGAVFIAPLIQGKTINYNDDPPPPGKEGR